MAGAGRLHNPYWKRRNLLQLGFVAVLCSASYFLGIWQHGGGGGGGSSNSIIASTVLAPVSCDRENPASIPGGTVTLDFTIHHGADQSEAGADQPAAAREFPACDVKYAEYTPCEDRDRSLRFDRDRLIYRERHCPEKGELLKCLIPAPPGYKNPFPWPASRETAWFANVPHKELTVEKAVQNWIRVDGDKFRFPGGGTMFPNGADAYIDDIDQLISLSDGSIRTAVDTGCGVASWGAYLLSRDVLAMSFAPRDSHEAQVQFALERGVPAMIGVLASIRLPYPSRAFDMAHCSRCLIPWQLYDGQYLMEIDRILRPGGFWVLSGPPINWKKHWKGWNRTREDLSEEQSAIEAVAKSLCWTKYKEVGDIAIWQKPINHMNCKSTRKIMNSPGFCRSQNPDTAWYTKMETCITPLPEVGGAEETAGGELKKWPERLTAVPPRIASGSLAGITPEMFLRDTELWKKRVGYYKTVNNQLGQKGRYRNLLDMNANFGGFAAALIEDPLWVMNIVPTEANSNTLGVIYERGLIGTYQNWCEAMSTYPRTYDLLHADSVFTLYKDRCEAEDILLEMDRILRPEGMVIIRDDVDLVVKIKSIADRMRWDSRIVDHEDGPLEREKILVVVKTYWTAPAGSSQE
ncbi:putative methyltransferase PMT15 [Canna indica]|uniref:Methyltransferase n=1 Tax=Canna indica TaxID=4628 RepID=A0AAQ3QEH6_9LILI|nr:putative methyltransferase PMT15 [Canna indica]